MCMYREEGCVCVCVCFEGGSYQGGIVVVDEVVKGGVRTECA